MDTVRSLGAVKARPRLICLSHLRWDFVHQRPQHLMIRAASTFDVTFFEEPIYERDALPSLRRVRHKSGVQVVIPILPDGIKSADPLRSLLDRLIAEGSGDLLLWYYTPMALEFSDHLQAALCVYDCMDELSAFKNPPPGLQVAEAKLFERADLVFTGGFSLFEAKTKKHPRVFAFPSSVDAAHFGLARQAGNDPDDQVSIPFPRIGFFGVIDERMDLDLVRTAATDLPDVQFVMIGPVVKIHPDTLPKEPNVHWLGTKKYEDLPAYLGHWNAGWMPFALNEATQFISPTKTPEFLAAGLPVTSTAIRDVVRGYGQTGLVTIADAQTMQTALRDMLLPCSTVWKDAVSRHLALMSWDSTWAAMQHEIDHLRSGVPMSRASQVAAALQ